MKLLICGYARHGKDTAAAIINSRYGLQYDSSSYFAMRAFVREGLALRHGLRYETEKECYEDRINYRDLWYNLISEYNRKDPSRLAREMFLEHDIYVGMRNIREFHACAEQGLVHLAIWVDATKRLGTAESTASNTITPDDCDFIITNNGTEEAFKYRLIRIFDRIIR